jgi:hypothetical protein
LNVGRWGFGSRGWAARVGLQGEWVDGEARTGDNVAFILV